MEEASNADLFLYKLCKDVLFCEYIPLMKFDCEWRFCSHNVYFSFENFQAKRKVGIMIEGNTVIFQSVFSNCNFVVYLHAHTCVHTQTCFVCAI